MGIGLSAACGFRVFAPLFVASLAAFSGHLDLAAGFEWLGTPAALLSFGLATGLEVAAYYVPWLDNLLDTAATPAAVVAGTLMTASVLADDMSPWLRWTLAAIAGGGAATLVQSGTVLVRGLSTAATGGWANPLFATAELGGALATSFTSLLAPVAAVMAVLLLGGIAGAFAFARLGRVRTSQAPPVQGSLPGVHV